MSNTTQALSRIEAILDDSSFVEIGAAVTARATDFNMQEKKAPSDGVITGYGVVNGNLVYVYSQDAAVLGGTIGEMHAKKIASLYEKAMKMGAPVIGLIDCAGLRLQEATDALNGFGEIYKNMSLASGIIPQITAVYGECGGADTEGSGCDPVAGGAGDLHRSRRAAHLKGAEQGENTGDPGDQQDRYRKKG